MMHPRNKLAPTYIRVLATALAFSFVHAATLEPVEYDGRPAYRLSDGKTEAVIVPSLSGRVMRFGKVGGPNWMWNAPPEKLKGEGYKNHGGDKTFVGPHPTWATFGSVWPPDASWDGPAHVAEVLPDGRLKTTGNIWRGFGVRVIRVFFYNESGEFVLAQTLEKVEGEPRQLAVWAVTQTATPDAVFIPLNERSAYLNGFLPFGELPATAIVEPLTESGSGGGPPTPRPTLLKITPTSGSSYKLGADSPTAAIAAVKSDTIFLQRGEKLQGQYPDGGEGAGLPVEFYNHKDGGTGHFVELELLSRVVCLKAGESKTLTTRWSLHPLPTSPHEQRSAVESLLMDR